MGIFSFALPPGVAFLSQLIALFVLFHNARTTPWKSLTSPGVFSAWCFSIIVLPLLWRFDIPVASGMTLHLQAMPLLVLMFGRHLAMMGIGLSVVAYTVLQDGLWGNIGMNLLLLAVVPAYCGDAVMRATRRFLPAHLFVYLLGNGFFGAFAMLGTIGFLSLLVHMLWTQTPVSGDALAFMLLLSWGEAFLTGFLLTIFTVYRPEWVLTFDDDVYLRK